VHKPDCLLVPHSDVGDPDCCGCVVPDIRGDVADLVCNECILVVKHDISVNDVNRCLLELARGCQKHKMSAQRSAERIPSLLGDARLTILNPPQASLERSN
jgi:hypothetical protein